MFLALWMEEQGEERNIEDETDDSRTEEPIAQGSPDVGVHDEVDELMD